MKKTKIFISTILSIIFIALSSIAYCSSIVNDISNGAKNIENRASSFGSKMNNDISNDINNVNNMNNSTTTTNRNNNTVTKNTTTENTNQYTTNRVAYTDTIDFFGIPMSRTSMILSIVGIAAIIIAILTFAYVNHDNDRYYDEE